MIDRIQYFVWNELSDSIKYCLKLIVILDSNRHFLGNFLGYIFFLAFNISQIYTK